MKRQLHKVIVIDNIYNYDELIAMSPLNTNIYSVELFICGYVHDVSLKVVFTLDGEGHGWDTLEQDFNKCVKECKTRWDYCIEYGYH